MIKYIIDRKGVNMAIVGYGIGAIISGIIYYLMLPAFNFASFELWAFIGIVLILFITISTIFGGDEKIGTIVFSSILGVEIVLLLILGVFSTPLLRADSYAHLIDSNIIHKNISEYSPTIDDVPLMDKDTAELLASRQMGSLVNEISQYDLGGSTQINYQNKPIRVMPLEYSGPIKWLNNKNVGIPAYITVDMTSQKTEIYRLEHGIRYSPSGYFGEDLNRHLRFKYPTSMLGTPVFEIDDSGNPYWVVAIQEHRVGLFGGLDVKGVLIVDAITGDITEYSVDEVPNYIDNVYPSDILIDLYNYYGMYQGGFWNSIFGQKGVLQVTEGYNYIPQDNDIWLYTGVTSVVRDESNVGFVYVNKRTKVFEYYEVAGAEEYSAMASAEGVVQHLGYTSTFPLLLQIEGQPTYCVALKDAAGLVKMYGLVNMSQYQIVVTADTMSECLSKYRTALKDNGQSVIEVETTENSGVVEDIRTANINGTTYFYIKVDSSPIYYAFSVSDNEEVVLVDIGETISFNANEVEGNIVRAVLK